MSIFFLLIWLTFAIVVGRAASARGRSALGWFVFAALFSPLIAVIFLIAFPSLRDEQLQRQRLAADDRALRRNIETNRQEPHF
jgi:hypothetical protein